MKRNIPILALTAFTVLGATSACSQEAIDTNVLETPAQKNELSQNESNGERVKREEMYRWKNESVAGSSSTKKFDVPKNYGNVKVWFRNEGTANVTLNVQKDHDQKFSHIVKPGKSYSGYSSSAFSTGDHAVHVSSGKAPLKGTLSVKVANTDFFDS
jgi:hypothetical protein